MNEPVMASLLLALAGYAGARSVAGRARDRTLALLRTGGWRAQGERRSTITGARRRRIWGTAGALLGLPVVYLATGLPGLVVAIAGSVAVPRVVRGRRRARIAEQLERQLAGAVAAIAAALRAGLSLSQAIRFTAAETEAPLADDLRRIAEREDLGVPLDRSLHEWEASSNSDDVHLVANVLRLRIGSGQPGVLDQVVGALRQRQTARAEVRSLTAQSRLSGTILGLLPIGFFLFLSIVSRKDMAAAYGTAAGAAAIGLGLALQVGAYFWIRRLVRVEV